MPLPNPQNPYHCDRPMRKSGKTKAGHQRYRCKCGYTCTDSPRQRERRAKGEKPYTQVEKNRRWKEKKKAKLQKVKS